MGSFEVMIIFLAVLIYLGFAGFCAWLAKSRGRDPIFWGILGFSFNLLALIVVLNLSKKKEGISERKEGNHRIMISLFVILLAIIASTVLVMVARPS